MSERSFDTLQGAMPRLAGFAWEANKQKQVCWGTPNGNLAEASVKTGGAWELTALNAVSNAPLASLADVTGYAWPKGNSKQVCYTTEANAHIHEIYVTFGGSWKHADLTQLAGAPPCVGWNMSGYAWNMGGTKQVAYVGANDHIYELYVGVGHSWQHADLTQIAGAPAHSPGSPVCGYAWEKQGSKNVVYKSANGHVHHLHVGMGGSWQHEDLMQITGAPTASGVFVSGFAWEEGATQQVVYVSSDGHIHELYSDAPGFWAHADLTQVTGAPTGIATGSSYAAYAWPSGGTKQVAYLGSGGHVHELYVGVGGSWKHANLTAIAGGPEPDVSGFFSGYSWEAGKSKQVVYTTNDGHVHELYVGVGGSWKHAVLPGLTH